MIIFCACVCLRVCTCNMGQAPWKQQQRSSAFKWIKTPAQSPGPAGIGQAGCSLDEDLRLIISHAAFVFSATVAYIGRVYGNLYMLQQRGRYWPLAPHIAVVVVFFFTSVSNLLPRISPCSTLNVSCSQLCRAAAVERFLGSECIPAVFMFSLPSCSLSYLRCNMGAAVMVSPGPGVTLPYSSQCVSAN